MIAFSEIALTLMLGYVADKAVSEAYTRFGEPLILEFSNYRERRYKANVLAKATQLALDALIRASPVKSGKYRDSFHCEVDGVNHPPGADVHDIVPAGSKRVVIGNLKPYNRKVDVQMIGNDSLRFSVPPFEYQRVADEVNASYSVWVHTIRRYNYDAFAGEYFQVHTGYIFTTPVLVLTLR